MAHMARKDTSDDTGASTVFVATRTAHIDVDGRREIIREGVTRISAGHALLKKYPDLFKEADKDLRFGVEDAVTRPSTSRSRAAVTPPADKPYTEWSKAELRAEIDKRNTTRTAEDQIHVPARASQSALAELLTASEVTPADPGNGEAPTGDPDGADAAGDQGTEPAGDATSDPEASVGGTGADSGS